jgi:Rrf2 family protein
MKLSTRIRYGVRLMLSLAESWGKGPVFLKDIAHEEDISEKYLSLIIIPLRTKGLVNSLRGAHGGYTLARSPETITLEQIVEAIEGKPSLVDCVGNALACPRSEDCVTRDIWAILGQRISETLQSISLERLVQMKRDRNEKGMTYSI